MPDKDATTGRFLPGNQAAKNPPHGIVVSHDGLRDTRGHWLPGCTGNGRGNHPKLVYEKKLALQEATTPEQVREVILELFKLATTSNNEFVKLAAANMFLDRTVGKPTKEVQIDKRETKVSADLSSLSDEQLRAIEAILSANNRTPEAAPLVLEGSIEKEYVVSADES